MHCLETIKKLNADKGPVVKAVDVVKIVKYCTSYRKDSLLR